MLIFCILYTQGTITFLEYKQIDKYVYPDLEVYIVYRVLKIPHKKPRMITCDGL